MFFFTCIHELNLYISIYYNYLSLKLQLLNNCLENKHQHFEVCVNVYVLSLKTNTTTNICKICSNTAQNDSAFHY